MAFSAVTNIFPYALEFAKRLKQKIDAPFVFGGVHASALPEYLLSHEEIDYVILGEGEHALEELAASIGKNEKPYGIRNLCYKKDNSFEINPVRPLIEDLDSLPFPEKDLFFRDKAFQNQLIMITSRGCLFKCSYCVNNFSQNKLYSNMPGKIPHLRRRSVDNVIEEIKQCTSRFPIDNIFITDEIFSINPGWLREFVEKYRKETAGLPFSFCYHPKSLTEETAALISSAGGYFAQGAIETANENLRRTVLKRFEKNEEIVRAAGILHKHNIKVSTSAIFGIPHETAATRWETIDLIEEISPDMVNSYIMYPFPGTEIADIALKDGFLSAENYDKICRGLSSYHQYSLLDLPDAGNAHTMAKLLPLYIKVPSFFKPLIKWMMKRSMPATAHFIYVVSVPFIYSGWTRSWIKNLMNLVLSGFSLKKRI